MAENKVLALVMLVMACGMAITGVSEGLYPDKCYEYKPLFVPCAPFLADQDSRPPTLRCCDEVVHVFGKTNNPATIEKLCTCLLASIPISGFYPAKLIQLPTACEVKLSFSIEKCING